MAASVAGDRASAGRSLFDHGHDCVDAAIYGGAPAELGPTSFLGLPGELRQEFISGGRDVQRTSAGSPSNLGTGSAATAARTSQRTRAPLQKTTAKNSSKSSKGRGQRRVQGSSEGSKTTTSTERDGTPDSQDEPPPSLDGDGQRNTGKRSHSESDGDPNAKKQRGRPRLDAQDVNPVDRRRTQIRLAQRAYRQRKETTISSLKKRVAELEGTIKDMSQSFVDFNDSTLNSGAVPNGSSLASDLKSTMRTFVGLRKRAEPELEDESLEQVDATTALANATPADAEIQKLLGERSVSPPAHQAKTTHPGLVTPLGYQVTEEADDVPAATTATLGASSQTFDAAGSRVFGGISIGQTPGPETEDDRHLTGSEMAQVFLSPRFGFLTPPGTFSSGESTFARYLQRFTFERAFRILNECHSSDDTVKRIFNLSFCFSSREAILKRLRAVISRSTRDSLDNWAAPFIHFGGAGTHYPRRDADGNVLPPPLDWTVQSIGPQYVARGQHGLAEPAAMANVPDLTCFGGEWYDANDVEGYLRDKGVRFLQHSDHAEMDIDEGAETVHSAVAPFEYPIPFQNSYPYWAGAPAEPFNAFTPSQSRSTMGNSSGSSARDDSEPQTPMFNNEFGLGAGFAGMGAAAAMQAVLPAQLAPAPLAQMAPSAWNPTANYPPPQHPDPVTNSAGYQSMPPYRRTRTIAIDVKQLVQSLVEKSVCLGRAPGFRRKDIDVAVQLALKAY